MAPPSSSTNRVTTKALLRSPLRQGLSAEGLQLVHGLVDPLFRHGVRGPQRLGEETDPQLLEHPPERLHVSTCTSCHRAVSYTHLRAHETGRNLVCRLLLEKKN